jgi:RHS repeat-associated protein
MTGVVSLFVLALTVPHMVWSQSVPGDANGDTVINDQDVTAIIQQILGLGTASGDADCNQDGAVNVQDVVCVMDIILQSGPIIPPDPGTVAPPLDPTVATSLLAATEFLYTGNNPIQTGVTPGTIQETRVAVLRGKVLDRMNAPLPGVTITILGHPEYGQTLSRADGVFDIVVNGGGVVTVTYEKRDYLSAQRQVKAPWQDYVWMPEVVMIVLDALVTPIDLAASSMQVARGSLQTDADGSRQATLLVPPGTQATMLMPDGSTQPLTNLNVRATEYTVGPNGPKAMPAELPPTSGYTYCVELSADEAIAAGAKEVRFSTPLYFYVEDFIGFPVGSAVPTGYYDRQKGQWIASENGRVIRILSITGVMADIDTNGDGNADDSSTLLALGITDAERQQLATLYSQTPKQLWRVPMTHLTPWDCNWPYGPPPDAVPSNQTSPVAYNPPPDPCGQSGGSVIECQTQVLEESVPVAGTPFYLHYRSDRAPGFNAGYALSIPLSGSTVPASLKRIRVEVHIAGHVFSENYDPAPNLTYNFLWNGKDAYGRDFPNGRQIALVKIFYTYGAYYYPVASDFANSFARISGGNGSGGQTYITGRDTDNNEIRIEQIWVVLVGPWDAMSQGLGGWTLNVHHAFDPTKTTSPILHMGSGRDRAGENMPSVIQTVAGTGVQRAFGSPGGDGGLATEAQLGPPLGLALGPDWSLYVVDGSSVRRVRTDGIITTVAGRHDTYGYNGDGIPATSALLNYPEYIAISSDGALYISDKANFRLRRVGTDGIISTVAGNGQKGYSGDGGPATEAMLAGPMGISLAPDGTIYFSDFDTSMTQLKPGVRRVGTDGIISTVAGNGNKSYNEGGILSTEAALYPRGLSLAADGSLYIAEYNRVGRVGTNGIIKAVAGTSSYHEILEGVLATEQNLTLLDLAATPEGGFYIADFYRNNVRHVGSDGIINTVAGLQPGGMYNGDNIPALNADLNAPCNVALAPNGNLYVSDRLNYRVREIAPPLPETSRGDFILLSEDGAEIYHFDHNGRHLRTLSALTNAVIYQFGYDGKGYLIRIQDGSGNITTIERDAEGVATGIVSPYGQRTSLVLGTMPGTENYRRLIYVTNPAGEVSGFSYANGGLLSQRVDPKNNFYSYTYDGMGRLISTADPLGGSTGLSRTDTDLGYKTDLTTPENRTTTYLMEKLRTEAIHMANKAPCCTGSNEILIGTDGSRTITYADGRVITEVPGPDPRFGMMAPVLKSLTVATPNGKMWISETSRTITTAPGDPFTLSTLTDTLTINGQIYTNTFDASTGQTNHTTPEGRTTTRILDSQGRVVQKQQGSLLPTGYNYDARGRLTIASQGTGVDQRTLLFAYRNDGRLGTMTDPLNRQHILDYDQAGRITNLVLPGGRETTYTYDAAGNLTILSPPGRPPHTFDYTALNLRSEYVPPDVGIGLVKTTFAYNRDRQLTRVTRPDGQVIDLVYDDAGRLRSLVTPQGSFGYTYNAATGQRVQIVSPNGGTLTSAYDGVLKTLTSWSGAVSGTLTQSYDNDFRPSTQSVNGGEAVSFAYDKDGLLIGAGALTVTRDHSTGFLKGASLGDITESWGYNPFGELTLHSATYGGGDFFHIQYSFDKLGRIIQKTETISGLSETYSYGYDEAGRLASVSKGGTPIDDAYTYDLNGNRLSHITFGTTLNGSYDDQDRLLQYGTTSYTYTNNGELLTKTNGSNLTTYQYDVLGNLMRVVLPDGREIDYVVDGENRRIGKKVNGTLTQGFLYQDSLRPVAELDGGGNLVSRFVYGTHRNVPSYMVKGGTSYRIITDHLGSPRLVVDAASGNVAQRMDYDEFGNVLLDTNPGFQPFGFAGGIYDKDTGLIRFGLRDYDSYIGRWTAKDPIRFAGNDTNLYSYVLDDPVNLRDPTGQTSLGELIFHVLFEVLHSEGSAGGKSEIEWEKENLISSQPEACLPDFDPLTKESIPSPLVKHSACSADVLGWQRSLRTNPDITAGALSISGESKCGGVSICEPGEPCINIGPLRIK